MMIKKKIKKIMSHSNFMNKKNCLISPLEINDFNDFSNNTLFPILYF